MLITRHNLIEIYNNKQQNETNKSKNIEEKQKTKHPDSFHRKTKLEITNFIVRFAAALKNVIFINRV